MVRPRRRAGFACVLLALAASVAAGCGITRTGPAEYEATVTRVVDGDTVVVRYTNGSTDKVRILGVDTPETHKPGTPVQCYGPEASQFTQRMLTGRSVRLELDVV